MILRILMAFGLGIWVWGPNGICCIFGTQFCHLRSRLVSVTLNLLYTLPAAHIYIQTPAQLQRGRYVNKNSPRVLWGQKWEDFQNMLKSCHVLSGTSPDQGDHPETSFDIILMTPPPPCGARPQAALPQSHDKAIKKLSPGGPIGPGER